jgi:5-methylcytosine-specific restriction endonuclease McrA
MKAVLERAVRKRAPHCCEYCRLPEKRSKLPFVLDHIIARQHGGKSVIDNLALCCGFCNRHKGPNVAGIDTRTKLLTPLFNPRRDRWAEHFRWSRERLIGLTAIGRVTIEVLAINDQEQLDVRRALSEEIM